MEEPEGVRRGHIPGALSLPANSLVDGGKFLAPELLRARFAAAGVDPNRQMTVYCATGIQSCAVVLAVRLVAPDAPAPAVYDASWQEWGRLPGVPVKGPAPPQA